MESLRTCPGCRKTFTERGGMRAEVCPNCRRPLNPKAEEDLDLGWREPRPARPPARTRLGIAHSELKALGDDPDEGEATQETPVRPSQDPRTCPSCKLEFVELGLKLETCPYCQSPISAPRPDAGPARKTRLGIMQEPGMASPPQAAPKASGRRPIATAAAIRTAQPLTQGPDTDDREGPPPDPHQGRGWLVLVIICHVLAAALAYALYRLL